MLYGQTHGEKTLCVSLKPHRGCDWRANIIQRLGLSLSVVFLFLSGIKAEPRAPLSRTAFDGGAASAEALGRGNTFSSANGTPASAVEDPSGLQARNNGAYSSVYLGQTSDVPSRLVDATDPLEGRVIQFISVVADKGSLFYQPLGRREERQIFNPASPTTDFRDIEFAADAIGFSGTHAFRRVIVGISIAYLRGSLGQTTKRTGVADQHQTDRGDGVRLNVGARFPTGPFMWGVTVQNAPGFLWWQDHRRQLLPVKLRFGNTWQVNKRALFTLESETRYYNEGANTEDFLYAGYEGLLSQFLVYRIGAFSDDIEDPDRRHLTAGLTFKLSGGPEISYALERFKLNQERVYRSVLSVLFPFTTTTIRGKRR